MQYDALLKALGVAQAKYEREVSGLLKAATVTLHHRSTPQMEVGKAVHWTQTAAGKRKLSKAIKRGWAAQRNNKRGK